MNFVTHNDWFDFAAVYRKRLIGSLALHIWYLWQILQRIWSRMAAGLAPRTESTRAESLEKFHINSWFPYRRALQSRWRAKKRCSYNAIYHYPELDFIIPGYFETVMHTLTMKIVHARFARSKPTCNAHQNILTSQNLDNALKLNTWLTRLKTKWWWAKMIQNKMHLAGGQIHKKLRCKPLLLTATSTNRLG